MTATEIIYNILAGYHELTVGAIFKKCADIKSIGNKKTVSNALTRLKKDGRVESVYYEDKGLWVWHIVRESPVASSEAAMRIGGAAAKNPASDTREPFRPDKIVVPVHPETGKLVLEDESCAPGPGDHFSHAKEMASDITEIHHEGIVETRKSDAHANTDDASQTAAADAVPLSDQTEAQAGWSQEAVEHTSNVLGISVQARDETQVTKQATPIPVGEAIAEYASYRWGEKESYLEGFLYGISFAERYHGIFNAD